jgi:hypothetical protein
MRAAPEEPSAGLRRYRPVQMRSLPRRGLWLELAMIGRNVVGCVVLAAAAAVARGSVALAAFGIDSLIDILAFIIVVWQLRAPTPPSGHAQRSQIIAIAFTGRRSTSRSNRRLCSQAPMPRPLDAEIAEARPSAHAANTDVAHGALLTRQPYAMYCETRHTRWFNQAYQDWYNRARS